MTDGPSVRTELFPHILRHFVCKVDAYLSLVVQQGRLVKRGSRVMSA
jgi:hypothetical protein